MPVVVAAALKLKKRERVALEEMVRSSSLPYWGAPRIPDSGS
jgi:hypothetical protein